MASEAYRIALDRCARVQRGRRRPDGLGHGRRPSTPPSPASPTRSRCDRCSPACPNASARCCTCASSLDDAESDRRTDRCLADARLAHPRAHPPGAARHSSNPTPVRRRARSGPPRVRAEALRRRLGIWPTSRRQLDAADRAASVQATQARARRHPVATTRSRRLTHGHASLVAVRHDARRRSSTGASVESPRGRPRRTARTCTSYRLDPGRIRRRSSRRTRHSVGHGPAHVRPPRSWQSHSSTSIARIPPRHGAAASGAGPRPRSRCAFGAQSRPAAEAGFGG